MGMKQYEVIVVGGGHGGVEASLAAARLGKKTAMFTLYLDTIAMMSCNPSIGGPGKSNLVAEMDILGGEMGRHTDKFNLQLKHLNESKGPAARITRGQADKYLYRTEMRKILEHTDNLEIIQDCVDEIIVEDGKIKGIITRLGIKYYAECEMCIRDSPRPLYIDVSFSFLHLFHYISWKLYSWFFMFNLWFRYFFF